MPHVNSQLFRGFLIVATLCMVVAIIVIGKPVLAPLALSCILAFVLTPVVRAMEGQKTPRGLAVGLTMTIVVAAMLSLSAAFVSQLGQLAAEMPQHEREITAKVTALREFGGGISSTGWKIIDQILAFGNGGKESQTSNEENKIPADAKGQEKVIYVENQTSNPWLEWVPSIIGPVIEPLATASVVIVFAAFMMVRRDDLRDRLLALVGRTRMTRTIRLLGDSSDRLGRYLLGLLSVNFGFAVCFAIGLYWIGVPYAALWGCVTFFFRFVPIIGTGVSMLLPLAISIATLPGWVGPLSVIACYVALEFSTGNFVEPWLFGKSVGMNPLAVLVALMFWTWAWGLVGLLLATPLTLMLVTMGRHFPCFEWLDLLLGDSHALPRYVAFFQRILAKDDVEIRSMLTTELRQSGPVVAMQGLILDSLAHADRELRRGAINHDKFVQVEKCTDELIEQIIAQLLVNEAQTSVTEPNELAHAELDSESEVKLQVATFSLGDKRGAAAVQVLLSAQPHVEIVFQKELATQRAARQCATLSIELVILSATALNSLVLLESACRTLRRCGYEGSIAVGWWRKRKLSRSTRRMLKVAGADYVTQRLPTMNRMFGQLFISHLKQDSATNGELRVRAGDLLSL